MRVWKVAEEKQLLFNAGAGNIDSIVAITDDTFVTGADSGALCVYNQNKVGLSIYFFPFLTIYMWKNKN